MLQQTLGVSGTSLVLSSWPVLGVTVGKHVYWVQRQHDNLAKVFAVRHASLTAAMPELVLQAQP